MRGLERWWPEIEGDGKGVPVLLRQYLKIGGELLAFNVDRNFSNALDGLVLVDLRKTDPARLETYGKDGVERFMQHHGELAASRSLLAARSESRNPSRHSRAIVFVFLAEFAPQCRFLEEKHPDKKPQPDCQPVFKQGNTAEKQRLPEDQRYHGHVYGISHVPI